MEGIRAQSDAGLALTWSLMKVKGDVWPDSYPNKVSLADICRADLCL